MEQRVTALENTAARNQVSNANAQSAINSTLTMLSSRVKVLSAQSVQYFASNNNTYANAGVGWVTAARPSVVMSTPTGRIKVGFGAAANGGNGIVGISATAGGSTVIDRASFPSSPAAGVYVSGGASFTPTGFKSTIFTVPANTPLTITLEMYASDTFVYFFGPNLLVEVAS
jgi:hypothetical protein